MKGEYIFMALSYTDFIASENITKDTKSRVKRFAPLAEEFFTERKLSVTDENITAFQEFCITEKGIAKNSVVNGISALKKYYAWKSEKENNSLSENNIIGDNIRENIISEDNIIANNKREKTEIKKVSLNIERKKYLQLSCLALKYDKNFSEICNIAFADLLEKYSSDIENITGIF